MDPVSSLLIFICVLAVLDLWRQYAINDEQFWFYHYSNAVRSRQDFWSMGFRIEDLEYKLESLNSKWETILQSLNAIDRFEIRTALRHQTQDHTDISKLRQHRITSHRLLTNDSMIYQIRCESTGNYLRVGLDDFRSDPRDECQLFTSSVETNGPHTMFEMIKLDQEAFSLKYLGNDNYVQAVPPPTDRPSLPWKLMVGGSVPGSAERFRISPEGYLFSPLMGGFFQCASGEMVKGYGGGSYALTSLVDLNDPTSSQAALYSSSLYGSYNHFRLEPVGERHKEEEQTTTTTTGGGEEGGGVKPQNNNNMGTQEERVTPGEEEEGEEEDIQDSHPERVQRRETERLEGEERVQRALEIVHLSDQLSSLQQSHLLAHHSPLQARLSARAVSLSGGGESSSSSTSSSSSSVSSTSSASPLRICLAVPMTSKGTIINDNQHNTNTITNKGVLGSPLWPNLFDSFLKSIDWTSNKYVFAFYLGFDKGDEIYDTGDAWSDFREEFKRRASFRMSEQHLPPQDIEHILSTHLSLKLMHFSSLSGAPSQVVSQLVLTAYVDGHDFFYQVNDDTILLTPNWVPSLVGSLALSPLRPHLGVTGPVDENNEKIFTHAFVHRTHLEIFGHLFPPSFKNWWSDDWISTVYGSHLTFRVEDVRIRHNVAAQKEHGYTRYEVDKGAQLRLSDELIRGMVKINQWLKTQQPPLPRLPLPSICGYIPLARLLVTSSDSARGSGSGSSMLTLRAPSTSSQISFHDLHPKPPSSSTSSSRSSSSKSSPPSSPLESSSSSSSSSSLDLNGLDVSENEKLLLFNQHHEHHHVKKIDQKANQEKEEMQLKEERQRLRDYQPQHTEGRESMRKYSSVSPPSSQEPLHPEEHQQVEMEEKKMKRHERLSVGESEIGKDMEGGESVLHRKKQAIRERTKQHRREQKHLGNEQAHPSSEHREHHQRMAGGEETESDYLNEKGQDSEQQREKEEQEDVEEVEETNLEFVDLVN